MRKIYLLLLLTLAQFSYAQKLNSSGNKQAQKAYESASQSVSYKFYDKAIEQLKQAIELDDRFVAAHQQMGDIYRKLADYKNAKASYLKVISLDAEFLPLTYYGLGESELNTGDYASALSHLQKYSAYPLQESSKRLVEN